VTATLYSYVNFIATYSLVISAVLITRDRNRIRGAYPALAFITCVLLYLIIDEVNNRTLRHLLVAGPSLIPFTFWLLARSMFQDKVISAKKLVIYTATTLLIYYTLYFIGIYTQWTKVAAIAGRVFSIFFIVLAVIEAQSGKNTDLDEARIQLRKYFTYFIGLIVLITILSELGLDDSEQQLPRLLQRTAILLFNTLFIVINFSVKSRLFDTRKKKPGVRHPELIEKIQSVMLDQELYRQEKLTIGQLAAAIGEQEYKVRKVINQEMGYRNFIDFTNSYRIKEATDLLKDRSKTELTILEIAYKTGFNSIGPFNRSFKQATGLTPTDYRNKHLNH
jgi:AraC-like DNA-binding protein